jgi:hypothetical protein
VKDVTDDTAACHDSRTQRLFIYSAFKRLADIANVVCISSLFNRQEMFVAARMGKAVPGANHGAQSVEL